MGVDFSELTKGLTARKTPTLNVHQMTAAVRKGDPAATAAAIEQVAYYAENLSRRLGELSFSRLGIWNFTNPNGERIAWVGSNGNFHGGAFKTLYVGANAMSDPANANIVASDSGVAITGTTFTLALNGITTTIANSLYEGSYTGIQVSDDATGTVSGLVPGFVVLHPPGGGNYSAILYADPTLDCGRLELRDGSESGGQDGLGRTIFLNGETGYIALNGGVSDVNGNEVLRVGTAASAVNDVVVANAAAGTGPTVGVSPGSGDTDVDFNIISKGTGNVKANGEIVLLHFYITFQIPGGAAAADYDGVQIVPDAAEIVSVTERHAGAASSGPTTLMLKKVPSGTALAAGTDTLSAGIDMTATVDTNQTGSLHGTPANYQFAAGDALGLVTTGTLTSVDSVAVTVKLKRI